MSHLVQHATAHQLRKDLPTLRSGQTVRVHQKVQDKDKERIQIFEGMVIAVKGGHQIGATVTVRANIEGVFVERVFPIHSPSVEKFEVVKQESVRRAKLYYLRRDAKKRKLREKEGALEKVQADVDAKHKAIADAKAAKEAAAKQAEEAKAKSEADSAEKAEDADKDTGAEATDAKSEESK